jgi:hypothetical protein
VVATVCIPLARSEKSPNEGITSIGYGFGEMAGKFEPKTPVNLAEPKDVPISLEELAKANGWFL